jgi:hypothetical protein
MAGELDDMIDRLRSLPELGKRAAPDVADVLRKSILETIRAGTDAEGVAWKPRKEDGGRPLVDAASAVKVAATGTRIFARVGGPESKHHLGRAKGGVRRGIIPTRLTPELTERVREVLERHFRQIVEGW